MLLRTAGCALAFLVALSVGDWPVAAPAGPQDLPTESSLEAASNGRLVRIGEAAP